MNDTNLGVIITSAKIRGIIYGTFVIAMLVISGAQVAFSAVPAWGGQPDWLTAALAVGAYLGIPVGSLAWANRPRVAAQSADGSYNVTSLPPAAAIVTPALPVAAQPIPSVPVDTTNDVLAP